jgi:Ca-activated chloride channel family protein
VVVAGSAHVLMPFTDDPAVLVPYLNALDPDLMPSDGKAFPQAAQLVAGLASELKDPLSVLVVTDGVPPPGIAAFDELHRKQGVGVIVLAVGDSGDATVGAPAIDKAGLERLIDRTDGALIELSFGSRDTGRILAALALHAAKTLDRHDARFWEDSGYLFVIPLALGVVLWFRRGFALGPALSLVALLFSSGCSTRVADIWLTPDQQGRLLFEQGRYAEAAERFQDPTWKGLSYYAEGKFADSAAAFAALETKQGLYNLGNAYAQGGKLAAALHAYNRALALSPTFRQARHNADLMRELIAAQQEDTDKDDLNQDPNQGPKDEKTKVSEDQLAHLQLPPPKPGEDSREPEEIDLSPAEEAAWLRHAESDPKDFLKRKLSILAARESTR